MALEFLVYGFFFGFYFKKKEYFWVRFLALGALEIATVVTIELFFYFITGGEFHYNATNNWDYRHTIFKFLFFLAIYAMTYLVFAASFKERVSTIFLVVAASFASQHIAHNASILIALSGQAMPDNARAIFSIAIREACMVASGLLVALYNVKVGEKASAYEGNSRRKVIASSIVIILCIGLYRLNHDLPSHTLVTTIGFSLYAIVSCSLLLLLFFGLWASDKTHAEAEAYRELVHQQKEQYELSKKNIDLINIKCHDLKHQIHALRTSENKDFVEELEHDIMIYDSSVKTGNEVLDVIIREKLLQHESAGVTMTCLIEGEAISFMDEMDIYSLFGNILSNAFESVKKLSDKSRRVISLTGRSVGSMFFLHEENYVDSDLTFQDDLPQTTKENSANLHGFGMKSMRRTAQKYNGEMTVKCSGGVFSIDFVFPVPNAS